jgi:hypothetical protein
MATKAVTGRGTIFSITTAGGSPATVPVLNMKTYAFSGQTLKFDDISNLNSSVNGGVIVDESLPATEDPGTFTATGIWIPSDPGQEALAAAWASHSLNTYTVQAPIAGAQTTTGNLYTMTGFLQDNPLPDLDYSKAVTIKFTVKLNSAVVTTQGS